MCLCTVAQRAAKADSVHAACQGGLRPHAFCLPILKREEHRQAVLAAATSSCPRFFLGTDSAPHPRHLKVSCWVILTNAFPSLNVSAQARKLVPACFLPQQDDTHAHVLGTHRSDLTKSEHSASPLFGEILE